MSFQAQPGSSLFYDYLSIVWPPSMEKSCKTRPAYNGFTYLGSSTFRKVIHNNQDLNGTKQILGRLPTEQFSSIILNRFIFKYQTPCPRDSLESYGSNPQIIRLLPMSDVHSESLLF